MTDWSDPYLRALANMKSAEDSLLLGDKRAAGEALTAAIAALVETRAMLKAEPQ